ncbi:MAG: hypothetical protein M3Q46_14795, partial [Verrucomicrobiota bacterium]|nr:hypothetical protein [Verrucomicrobiota bacterium]
EQKQLRDFYGKLLGITNEPAFRDGGFFGLNAANNRNPSFGQVGTEPSGGHWLYAFLRVDPLSRQRFLGVVNLHPTSELKENRVLFPKEAIEFLRFRPNDGKTLHFSERLAGAVELTVQRSSLGSADGLALPLLAPLTAYFFEIKSPND